MNVAPAIDVERSVVTFGTTSIAYAVRRSTRRRTVSVAVDSRSAVVVTAPAAAAREQLDRVVQQKAPWILERLRRRSDLPPPAPSREFISGENYYYLGKQYRLHLERGAAVAPLRLTNGRLHLAVPADLSVENEARYASAALTDWYVGRATAVLPHRVRRWSTRIGVTPSKVLITKAAKRWGSASIDGTIRLNWLVVQAPSALVDYVVAHELVHLLHRDHGRAFWAKLGRVMPHYEERKERLRALGPLLAATAFRPASGCIEDARSGGP